MGSFSDPLSRQLDKSVRIAMVHNHGKVLADRWPDRTVLFNRKDEHYQPRAVLPSFGTLGNLLQGWGGGGGVMRLFGVQVYSQIDVACTLG